jgi:hypothetical protein
MKTYEGWRYSSTVIDLGIRWRWVVSFTPRPLNLRGKSPLYPLDRRLSGPHGRSVEKGQISYPRRELNPDSLAVQPVGRRYTDWTIPAPWLVGYYSKFSDTLYKLIEGQ